MSLLHHPELVIANQLDPTGKLAKAVSEGAERRRETFQPATLPRVTLWRVISRDPDENEDVPGILVQENETAYWLIAEGEFEPRAYPKRTREGVTIWRKARA